MFTVMTDVLSLPDRRASLRGACVGHALHDGYTDLLYALLPVWQAQFGLSYAGLAGLRALYYGTMSGLQVPGSRLTRAFGARAALAGCTLVAAAGFALMSLPLGMAGLCLGLLLAGLGSSIQHPRGSLVVTNAYGTAARGPLGIYNFAGDVGKAALPALVALLLPVLAWQSVTALMAGIGVLAALALVRLLPTGGEGAGGKTHAAGSGGDWGGFGLLMAVGGLDSAVRMGYLLFLPFLVQGRGGDSTVVGIALALLFIGGALGKAGCGWLGARLGVVRSVAATELLTALLILITLFVPLAALLALLPVLGMVLNGTSSVLYGTVPELAPEGDTGRAFAYFYTAATGSGALAPMLFGAVADRLGQDAGVIAAGLSAVVVVPLVLLVGRYLRD